MREKPASELAQDCKRALQCLYIAVDESVAKDVNEKVRAYIGLLESRKAEHVERLLAEKLAHRACGNQEQDLQNGKIAGYCVVCQAPWPCSYAIKESSNEPELVRMREALSKFASGNNWKCINGMSCWHTTQELPQQIATEALEPQ